MAHCVMIVIEHYNKLATVIKIKMNKNTYCCINEINDQIGRLMEKNDLLERRINRLEYPELFRFSFIWKFIITVSVFFLLAR